MNRKIKGLQIDGKGYFKWQPPMRNGQRDSPIYLGTKDYIKAVVAYEEAKRNWELGDARLQGSSDQAVAEYLNHQRQQLIIEEIEPKTVYRAENQLPIFMQELSKELGNKPVGKNEGGEDLYPSIKLNKITKEDIEKWRQGKATKKSKRTKKPLSKSTIDTYQMILKGLFTWCVKQKMISESPFAEIKIKKPKKTESTKFYTLRERDKMLENPPCEAIDFILHFGFYAGLRIEEINAMEASWIQGNIIHIQKTDYFKPKDKEHREVPLNPKLKDFLKRYGIKKKFMFAPHKATWLPTPSNPYRYDPIKRLKKYVEKTCEIDHFSFSYHKMRASFGTHLAMSGKLPIATIAALLGDDIATTERHYIGQLPTENSTDCL